MKRTHKYLLQIGFASVLLAGLSSCEKQLFEEPYKNLSPEQAFATAERIEKSAVGMYDKLQNPEYLGGRVLIYADIRSIDTNVPTFFGQMPNFNTLISSDGTVANAWQGGYRTIYEANLFVKNLDANKSKVTDAKYTQYVSEAKFIRALSYYYLVSLWAQPYKFKADASHPGVPLILEAADDPFAATNQVARATVAQVYTQLETDLKAAIDGLPADYSDANFSNVARATKAAAQGLLARLYLDKGDYASAKTYADAVIASKKYSLNATPDVAFRTYTSPENIFSVAHNGADNPNTNNALGQHYAPDKRGDISISKDYTDLFEATDLRLTTLTKVSNSQTWTTKYTSVTDWAPILRYPEILLIKAEAEAQLASDVSQTAVDLVNQIRTRSKATAITAPAAKADLIDAILKERRRELSFEGHGIIDFLRTGRGIPAHSIVGAQPYGSNYVVLPLPLYDMQKNPKLVQNDGY
ncbi:MAG: RagB/SusD family nutrient uptake outer membrane protein [Siphonobacter aquaeclarae]|jgi:hypothetical protein|nr:RagB/SusD family nutrient uptake outer membrane protein [Siphonobacter aquaeclarae]